MTLFNRLAYYKKALGAVSLALILYGCNPFSDEPERIDKDAPSSAPTARLSSSWPAKATDWLASLQRHSQAQGEHVQQRAETLSEAVQNLLDHPNAEQLNQTRQAWHKAYQAFQAWRASLSLNNSTRQLAFQRIDPWPVQVGYLDNLPEYPNSGLVHDSVIKLSAKTLKQQHQLSDSSEVTLGFPAMAVLLWGVDTKDDEPFRQAMDFQVPATHQQKHPPPERRRRLLELQAQLLLQDIASLHQANNALASDTSEARFINWLHTFQQHLQRCADIATDDMTASDPFSAQPAVHHSPVVQACLDHAKQLWRPLSQSKEADTNEEPSPSLSAVIKAMNPSVASTINSALSDTQTAPPKRLQQLTNAFAKL